MFYSYDGRHLQKPPNNMTMPGYTINSASMDATTLQIHWDSGEVSYYHHIWLRDNCHCPECYHEVTKQRLLNSCSINDDITPAKISTTPVMVSIIWDQYSHKSQYSTEWLSLHSYNPRLVPNDLKIKGEKDVLKQQFWKVQDVENALPSVNYKDIMNNDDAVRDWCLKIWKFGFCLVDDVPVTPEDTEKLVERIVYIRPTHYGGFWDFTSDLSKHDTAYTNIDISSHTDGTYWNDTPGLQLFHLLSHEGEGGASSLVDAFQCAFKYKEMFPEYFDLLTKIPVPAHSAGEEDVCIQPDIPQPIFKLDNDGKLVQIRWNQSDRSTMNDWKNPDDVIQFYKAIKEWYKLITKKENELFYQLKPGQCLIFDNWRCFHSRTEFTGKRRMCGAYVNRDDFMSRLKLLNLGRKAVLDTL